MISKFSDRLYADLTRDLNALALEEDLTVRRLEKSIHVCLKYLQKLKDFCKLHDPATQEQEIQFFKFIKPKFKCQLIFYQTLLNLELRKPIGEGKVVADYFEQELRIIHQFFTANYNFHQYVRSQATYLDEYYYVRGNYNVYLDPDQCVIDFDQCFSTTHDNKLAQVLASTLLHEHLAQSIARIMQKEAIIKTDPELGDFDWKKTKVALIELVYSWHDTEAFGKKNLKSIVKFIEKAFNVSLGNFYDTYDWLCGRPVPTLYIDEMREAFLTRLQKKLK
jgi:hypothetical protein